jgi:hypothetical protein
MPSDHTPPALTLRPTMPRMIRSVDRAVAIKEADPELFDKVKRGEITGQFG